MVKNRFVVSLISCVLLSTCLSSSAKHSHEDKDKSPNAGLIVAGVGAAVTAIGGLLWAFQSDDPETTLNKSQATYREITSKYEEAFDRIENDARETRFFDEALLSSCALAGIHTQCKYVSSSISKVLDTIDAAEKATLKAKNECLKEELRAVVNKLRSLKNKLVRIDECLTVHCSFFDLFELKTKLANAHARELDTYMNRLRTYDSRHYFENLNSCLNLRYSSHDAEWKYPYLAYAKKTNHDIRELERVISRASSCYYALLQESKQLLTNLKRIHHVVVNAPEYHNNLRDQEREYLERERLELERARLRAEQERADIERARLRAERDKVEIERARLHEERLNNIRHYCSICAHEWYAFADRCKCSCCIDTLF